MTKLKVPKLVIFNAMLKCNDVTCVALHATSNGNA